MVEPKDSGYASHGWHMIAWPVKGGGSIQRCRCAMPPTFPMIAAACLMPSATRAHACVARRSVHPASFKPSIIFVAQVSADFGFFGCECTYPWGAPSFFKRGGRCDQRTGRSWILVVHDSEWLMSGCKVETYKIQDIRKAFFITSRLGNTLAYAMVISLINWVCG